MHDNEYTPNPPDLVVAYLRCHGVRNAGLAQEFREIFHVLGLLSKVQLVEHGGSEASGSLPVIIE